MPRAKSKIVPISIVIPVYNEAAGIRDCLESIAKQTVRPLEVIAVDNNSRDGSIDIVREFNFVRIVHEPIQGMIIARNRGFKEAKGDIIARIDGDSVLTERWLEVVYDSLKNADRTKVVGCAGPLYFKERGRRVIDTFLHRMIYFGVARIIYGRQVFFGSNMAFYRDLLPLVWDKAKGDKDKVHEDIDLTMTFKERGRVVFNKEQMVGISYGKAMDSFSTACMRIWRMVAFWKYYWR